MYEQSYETKQSNADNMRADHTVIEDINTPTLDKMVDLKHQTDVCCKFLEWLQNRYAMFDKKIPREDAFYRGKGDYINEKAIVYEFLGIDQEDVNQELDALLDSMLQPARKDDV